MNVSFDFNFWTMGIFILNFVMVVFTTISNRSKASSDDLKKSLEAMTRAIRDVENTHFEHISGLKERLTRVEADVANGIDDSDITAVHQRVDQLLKSVGHMEGQLSQIVHSIGQISSNMMHRS